jgi:hypothetical protein
MTLRPLLLPQCRRVALLLLLLRLRTLLGFAFLNRLFEEDDSVMDTLIGDLDMVDLVCERSLAEEIFVLRFGRGSCKGEGSVGS